MELHQIDTICLQALQGFLDLPGGGFLCPTVDLRHEEGLLPVSVPQSLPHADFAGSVIIVPTVVHEGDPAVDGAADDRNALGFVSLFADMIPAPADGRDFFSS